MQPKKNNYQKFFKSVREEKLSKKQPYQLSNTLIKGLEVHLAQINEGQAKALVKPEKSPDEEVLTEETCHSNKPDKAKKCYLKIETLNYDQLKRELIRINDGNDITAKFATRTIP